MNDQDTTQLLKEEKKQIELEQRQKQNIENRQRAIRGKRSKTVGIWITVVVVILAVIGVIWFFGSGKSDPGPDFSRSLPFEGEDHLEEGTPIEYQSNPPTSGPHWPQALADGLYDEEKPDEAVVHSMEHGRVWISYNPERVSEKVVESLRALLKGRSAVILTPRSANETDITLAAWRRLDTFDLAGGRLSSEEENRILDFIKRYRHKGPEVILGPGPGKTY